MFRTGLLQVVSLAAVFLLLVTTMPVSATDFTSSKTSLGVVRGGGQVQLRGTSLNDEGTIFTGDHLHTGSGKSYAKAIINGNRLELLNDSEFVVNQSSQALNVGLISGAVAFQASSGFVISFADYEVVPAPGSKGVVAIVTGGFAGIYSASGDLTLINKKDKSSHLVSSGTDRFLNLSTGQIETTAVAQLASATTVALPSAPARAAAQGPTGPAPRPAGQGPTGGAGGGAGAGLSHAAWIGIIAAVAGGVTIAAVAATRGNGSPSRP